MALTVKDIEKLADMARIRLTAAEVETFAAQLNSALEGAEALTGVRTEGVEPLFRVLPFYNVMREDVSGPSLSNEEAMANAPAAEDAKFKVPRLI